MNVAMQASMIMYSWSVDKTSVLSPNMLSAERQTCRLHQTNPFHSPLFFNWTIFHSYSELWWVPKMNYWELLEQKHYRQDTLTVQQNSVSYWETSSSSQCKQTLQARYTYCATVLSVILRDKQFFTVLTVMNGNIAKDGLLPNSTASRATTLLWSKCLPGSWRHSLVT